MAMKTKTQKKNAAKIKCFTVCGCTGANNKKFLTHILSKPNTTADQAVYVLTGSVLIEGIIHKHVLSLFSSICRFEEGSTARQLAERQLHRKATCRKTASCEGFKQP